ncbi:hypothetical protein JNUCC42_03615 [Brevibacterium sp. JNUCC-42]|nr:hypothetical protein JNUCC42_03615 [Brevibacterium sp. JNUCC-42]
MGSLIRINKKALKWIIGSLVLAIIVPAVAFMLIQELAVDKHDNKHDAVYSGETVEVGIDTISPEEMAEAEQRYNELKSQGLLQETVNPDGSISVTGGGQ